MDITEYVRNNAGKAFEFMLEVVEADRKEQGLPDIATARAEAAENPEVLFTPLSYHPRVLLEIVGCVAGVVSGSWSYMYSGVRAHLIGLQKICFQKSKIKIKNR